MRPFLLALVVLIAPGVVQAQAAAPAPACARSDAGLPPELAAWSAKAPLSAANGVTGLDKAVLTLGQAYAATLVPATAITYEVKPDRPQAPDARGGLFAVDVLASGTYAIALGAGAWVDVVKGRVAQRSTAHGHGPACSTIRKIVSFDLRPGRYVIQISSSAEAILPILVAARP